ncbi:MAG: hypothetical protein DMG31_09380 [Acidobacteria bacterium]|nr:MAG: hypothetical protein DMG31_09380 [Acidobacteriota bacterium]
MRQKRRDFVDARKLLITSFNAAKLILLVDVRGEETFARKNALLVLDNLGTLRPKLWLGSADSN